MFRPGVYLIGALFVKSGTHLRIDEGVELRGSQNHDLDIEAKTAGSIQNGENWTFERCRIRTADVSQVVLKK